MSTSNVTTLSEPQCQQQGSLAALISWALYDWANSAFAAIIQTFVFAAYFVDTLAINPSVGSAQWGSITGLSALIVALISPIFGAIADQSGGRKIWLGVFTSICIIPTALMWFLTPSHENVWSALWLVGIAAVGAEGAYIFYNSMLPELAPPTQVGRWSGWGWGMGYAGGMAALVIALFAFVNGGKAWFPLDISTAEPIRATFLLTAVWYAIFSIPLFIFAPRSPPSNKPMVKAAVDGVKQLGSFLLEIRKYASIVRFLIAKMLYVDGLATLFAFGGIYAATIFGMTQQEVLEFGISMNVVAGLGAASLAFLDDWFGSKKVIIFSLVGLIIPGTMALWVTEKWEFWTLGLIMCIFVGPVQSSSRALMARVAPVHMRRQMFGFYMLSGKATAFFGPLLYGWVTYLTGSLRLGMSTIIILFILGGLIILSLPSDKSTKAES
ncbi:MAG: MFS transporter [Parachlamydiaceae bacterium]